MTETVAKAAPLAPPMLDHLEQLLKALSVLGSRTWSITHIEGSPFLGGLVSNHLFPQKSHSRQIGGYSSKHAGA